MKNKYVVESLMVLLKGYKAMYGDGSHAKENPLKKDLSGIVYLIGQTIRQYKPAPEKIHVSVKAYELWNRLTDNTSLDICDYDEKIECTNIPEGETVDCDQYSGSSNDSTKLALKRGETFQFNNLFHSDHIVPVCLIRDELIAMETIEERAIIAVLDKMHIAKLLKGEDRSVGRTSGRTLDYKQVIRDIYEKATPEPVKLINL